MKLSEYSIFVDFQEWWPEIIRDPYHLSNMVSPANMHKFTVERMINANGILCVSNHGLTIADAMIEVDSNDKSVMYYVAYTPLGEYRVARVASEAFNIDSIDNLIHHFLNWVANQKLIDEHRIPFLKEWERYEII